MEVSKAVKQNHSALVHGAIPAEEQISGFSACQCRQRPGGVFLYSEFPEFGDESTFRIL
jgi:hypothetical protein